MDLDFIQEFSSISKKAIKLDFLSKYLFQDGEMFVNPITGFVTSSRKMSPEAVASYWSDVIFPDESLKVILLPFHLQKHG
jgi:hypothetical protein